MINVLDQKKNLKINLNNKPTLENIYLISHIKRNYNYKYCYLLMKITGLNFIEFIFLKYYYKRPRPDLNNFQGIYGIKL